MGGKFFKSSWMKIYLPLWYGCTRKRLGMEWSYIKNLILGQINQVTEKEEEYRGFVKVG